MGMATRGTACRTSCVASRTVDPVTTLRILHVPDCPHVGLLEERLGEVIHDRDVRLTRCVVDTVEAAIAAGMHGSPTLLVDGTDPFAEHGVPTSLTCRYYRDELGGLDGAPTVSALRRVLIPRANSSDEEEGDRA